MIPGFSAAPMFIKTAGGVAASGRVKFSKYMFDASNYSLSAIDTEIYTNITGHDIEIGALSVPDLYSLLGIPSPYGLSFGFIEGGAYVEYSYSSASLGSITTAPSAFIPDLGYFHTSTSGVVAGFATNVWYDFSIMA